jgi:hypothetical protein
MVRDHQPGEAVFRSILPEDIDWKPFPAFPPSACGVLWAGEADELKSSMPERPSTA